MKVGRIIGTAVLGLLLFLFVGIDLVLFGVVALDSIVLTLFPFLGWLWGRRWALLFRSATPQRLESATACLSASIIDRSSATPVPAISNAVP